MLRLLYPTKVPFITQPFGNPGKHYGADGHHGVDFRIKNDPGRLILAAQAGKVIHVYTNYDCNWYKKGNWNKGSAYGIHIIIEHVIEDTSYFTLYAHLRSVLVSEGVEVPVGMEIAVGGNTGLSTAPHLHFELRKDTNKLSSAINPSHYFNRKLPKSKNDFPKWAKEACEWTQKENLFELLTEEDIRDAVKFHRLYKLLTKKTK